MLTAEVARIDADNLGVDGARKTWRALVRDGVSIGRDRTWRLMRALGLAGATRSRRIRTTVPAPVAERPADLVNRTFSARAPDRLWVADLTYVWTFRGSCYTAFVIDAFSGMIVGWRVSSSLRTNLALDALEMAVWSQGGDLSGLVHHSDRGVQVDLKIKTATRCAAEWPRDAPPTAPAIISTQAAVARRGSP